MVKRKKRRRSRLSYRELKRWREVGEEFFEEVISNMVTVNVESYAVSIRKQAEPPLLTHQGHYFWVIDLEFGVTTGATISETAVSVGGSGQAATMNFNANFTAQGGANAITPLPDPFVGDSIHYKVNYTRPVSFSFSGGVGGAGVASTDLGKTLRQELFEALDSCALAFFGSSQFRGILGPIMGPVYARTSVSDSDANFRPVTVFDTNVSRTTANSSTSGHADRFRYGGSILRKVYASDLVSEQREDLLAAQADFDEGDFEKYRMSYTMVLGMRDSPGDALNPYEAISWWEGQFEPAALLFATRFNVFATVAGLLGHALAGALNEDQIGYVVIGTVDGDAEVQGWDSTNLQVLVDPPDLTGDFSEV